MIGNITIEKLQIKILKTKPFLPYLKKITNKKGLFLVILEEYQERKIWKSFIKMR